jgi:hypothetical protein
LDAWGIAMLSYILSVLTLQWPFYPNMSVLLNVCNEKFDVIILYNKLVNLELEKQHHRNTTITP